MDDVYLLRLSRHLAKLKPQAVMVLKAAGISASSRSINYAARRSERRLRILANPAPATILMLTLPLLP